ncbi:MAG: hypothetical protein C4341_00485 [Armatimonadota bacterium]
MATHSGLATMAATFLTAFAAAALLLHVAVGVMGHAIVERTRQSALSLEDMTERVRATTLALQRNSERATNPSSVAAWARLHGFQSSFVASRQDAEVE